MAVDRPGREFATSLQELNAATERGASLFRDMRTAMEATGTAAAALGRGFQTAVASMRQVSQQATQLLTAPMQAMHSAISAMQTQVAAFVRLAAPGVVQRFQLAVDDLWAAIGRSLIPVMNQMTATVRVMGSVFAGLSSEGSKVVQALAGGTIALIAFGAALLLVQTVASAGLAPILTALAGSLVGVLSAGGKLQPFLDTLADAFAGVFEAVGQMLSALEPAVQVLVSMSAPFLGILTAVIKTFAGVIEGLAPLVTLITAWQAVLIALISPVQVVIEAMGGALVAAATLLGEVVQMAVPYVLLLAQAVAEFAKYVIESIRALTALLGINLPEGQRRSAVGGAVRQVQTQDVSAFIQRARESAFAIGAGAKPDEQTASNTRKIADEVAALRAEMMAFFSGFPTKLWNEITELPGRIGRAIREAPGKVAESVERGVTGRGGITDQIGDVIDKAGKSLDKYLPELPKAPSFLR